MLYYAFSLSSHSTSQFQGKNRKTWIYIRQILLDLGERSVREGVIYREEKIRLASQELSGRS